MPEEKNECINLIENATVILLDIEGTTTSISFVKDELFPFARNSALEYLKENWLKEETQQVIQDLIEQISEDVKNSVDGSKELPPFPQSDENDGFIEILVQNIKSMMNADRKIGPLKKLQGHIWRQGYLDGQLKGHLYEDVLNALQKWKAEDKRVFIYSSGSIEAQKLLFKFSTFGNLLHIIEGHFDTSVGSKIEATSYKKISQEIDVLPDKIVFITDIPKEARAAKDTGLSVILSRRPGNSILGEEDLRDFPVIDSFCELFSNKQNKGMKRKLGACLEDFMMP